MGALHSWTRSPDLTPSGSGLHPFSGYSRVSSRRISCIKYSNFLSDLDKGFLVGFLSGYLRVRPGLCSWTKIRDSSVSVLALPFMAMGDPVCAPCCVFCVYGFSSPSIPQQKHPLNHLLIYRLFTTTTIWRGMPLHHIICPLRTIIPTQATGLNAHHDKKEKQSYPTSFHRTALLSQNIPTSYIKRQKAIYAQLSVLSGLTRCVYSSEVYAFYVLVFMRFLLQLGR